MLKIAESIAMYRSFEDGYLTINNVFLMDCGNIVEISMQTIRLTHHLMASYIATFFALT